jgi:hypothetical protein
MLLLPVAALYAPALVAAPPLRSGAVITASARYSASDQLLPDRHDDGSGAALTIAGDNITVDFGGAVLRGTPQTSLPSERVGTGVVVRGKNVTIKNLRVHGYKIGLIARDSPNLKIEDSDFSYNWKPRLASTLEREDTSDWLSFHQNEKDEWLGHGAGIYLRGCSGFTVRGTRITGGQCGLMLTRCDRGLVAENDFSYLSGIGLGMYRSSENRILQNNIDWCVRGYSHGVYNRGQDSAGILIYEQSSKNVFAYNSVTHGGDGFFLWAGQSTMDTGKGGCDDNLVYGNDFSHSPTNGIEATFSRNTFANNLILECWHGVWGGYSYSSRFVGNQFGLNAEGIAIEHGRDNAITDNRFDRDLVGIRLWQNARLDPNWTYPKRHETASRSYKLLRNHYKDVEKPVDIRDTESVVREAETRENLYPAPSPTMQSGGSSIALPFMKASVYLKRFENEWRPALKRVGDIDAPALQRGAKMPFLSPTNLRGRRYILVDEWGPYDFRRPILWPRGEADAPNQTRFEVLGPVGNWRVVSVEGATLSADSGRVPGEVVATINAGRAGRVRIELEYIGGQTTDVRGVTAPAGQPVRVVYDRFDAPISWKVDFYSWDKVSDPRTQPQAFGARLKTMPLASLETQQLDFAGNGRFAPGVPADYFATVADGRVSVPKGRYVLDVTTDDGCRVSLDGHEVLSNAWKYQGPTLYSIPMALDGAHHLQVQHFQIDGYAVLKVRLRPDPS